MSHFMELDLPKYSFIRDNVRMNDQFCISCLRKCVPYINLANCEHAKILDNLLEVKMLQLHNHVMCSWCHNTLKKIDEFKIQATKSINILHNGLKEDTRTNYLQNFKFSSIELQSAVNSQPIETETIEHPANNESRFEIGTEVKIEQGDLSDFEPDMPSVESRKNQKKSKIKKNSNKKSKIKNQDKKIEVKRKRKPKEIANKKEGKVKIVVLSKEEMLREREKEAMKNTYLNLPYKCEKCITAFDHELNLLDHLNKRHKTEHGGHVCDICESVLNTKSSFEEHYKRHYRRYECMVCGKRNNNVYSVLKHYNETHGKVDLIFSCKDCDYTSESHRSYRYHRDKHRTAKVECDQCGNTFVNKAGLRVHMLTVHKQSNRVYACEPCGKVYKTKSGLSAHVSFTHAAAAPAYCAPCDLSFRSPAGLKHHLKTASRHVSDTDKRFTCNDCEAKFLTKRLLQDHIDWEHLKNYTQHICSKCSKLFKNSRCLKRHQTFVHEKKRPPRNKICDHCGRGFTSSAILLNHIRTHTGERPLQCTHCSANFAHSSALYTHTKLLHNKRNQ